MERSARQKEKGNSLFLRIRAGRRKRCPPTWRAREAGEKRMGEAEERGVIGLRQRLPPVLRRIRSREGGEVQGWPSRHGGGTSSLPNRNSPLPEGIGRQQKKTGFSKRRKLPSGRISIEENPYFIPWGNRSIEGKKGIDRQGIYSDKIVIFFGHS